MNESAINDTPDIQEQVARIAASSAFKRRRKLLDLFQYLVAETVAGRAGQLSTEKIGAAVFLDATAVRISAGRLRQALAEYYRYEAEAGEIRLHLPYRKY